MLRVRNGELADAAVAVNVTSKEIWSDVANWQHLEPRPALPTRMAHYAKALRVYGRTPSPAQGVSILTFRFPTIFQESPSFLIASELATVMRWAKWGVNHPRRRLVSGERQASESERTSMRHAALYLDRDLDLLRLAPTTANRSCSNE